VGGSKQDSLLLEEFKKALVGSLYEYSYFDSSYIKQTKKELFIVTDIVCRTPTLFSMTVFNLEKNIETHFMSFGQGQLETLLRNKVYGLSGVSTLQLIIQ
jgi:hypothetical protein